MSLKLPDDLPKTPRRWQFTLRQILVATTVLAVIMACYPFLEDALLELTAIVLYIVFAAFWYVLLFRTAAAETVFKWRTILVGIAASGLHFALWLWISEGSNRDNEFFRILINRGELLSLPTSFMTLSLFGVSLWALSPYHTDRFGRWAGRWTLALLFLYGFPIAAQSMHPENIVRGDDFVFFIQYPITFVACMPWFIVWRRRQLFTRPFASTRWDSAAKLLVWVAYILNGLTWVAIAAVVIYADHHAAGRHVALSFKVMLVWVGGHSLAGLFFVFSGFIQWFRDRWRFALNLPCVLCLFLLWLFCLYKTYATPGF